MHNDNINLIRELENKFENITYKINVMRNSGKNVSTLEKERSDIFEQLRVTRRLQYDSQFDINDDNEY